MADPITPREGPQKAPAPISKTLSTLYTEVMQGGVLTPEQQETLRTNYAKILATKREEVLSDTTQARRELQRLLGGVSDGDAVLAKLDPFLPGSKTVDTVKATAAKVPEGAKAAVAQARDALGDLPDAAQKAAESALAQGGKAAAAIGEAVQTGNVVQAGAALSKAVDESSWTLAKIGGAIGAFFAWLGSLLSFSGDAGKKWDEFLGKLGFGAVAGAVAGTAGAVAGAANGAAGAAASATEAARARVEEGRKLLTDAEKQKLIAEKYWGEFVKAGWIKDPVGQKKQFEDTFKEYAGDLVDISKEMGANIADPSKEWNAFDTLWKVGSTPCKFILALIARDIIPKQAIATTIYDAGRASLRVYLLSPYTLVSNGPSKFLHDFGILGPSDITGLKDIEKQALIGVMSHTMAVPLYISGKLTSSLTRLMLLGSYWDQGTGKAKIFASVDSITGDFMKAANQIDGPGGILEMLGDNTKTKELREYTTNMREIAEEMKMRALVTETFRSMQKTGALPYQIADEIEKLTQGKKIIGLDLAKMRTTTNITEARSAVSEYLTRGKVGLNWLDDLRGFFRNSVNPLSTSQENLTFFKNNAQEALGSYGKSLDEVLKADSKVPVISELIATWKKLKLGGATSELIDGLERGHLPVKVANVSDAKGVVEQLIKTIPKGFEHLFAGVTIVLTVQHVTEAKPDEKLKTAALDILAINPLAGGVMLMYEGATMQGGTPTKLAYFAGGGVITALGTKQALSMIAEHGLAGGLGRLIVSPITMTYEAGTAAIRGSQYAYSLAKFGVRGGGMAPFLRARAPGALLIGGIITYLIMNEIFTQETKALMKSVGFFKPDGGIDNENIKTAWNKLPSDKKPKILQELLTGVFDKPGVTTTLKNDGSVVVHSEGGSDTVSITADVFDAIYGMFGDLGISNPKVFMSEVTTREMRSAIEKLPVDVQRRQEFMKRFGITA